MPWSVPTMSEARRAFLSAVAGGEPVAAACRRFGVSRKTGYKWLARAAADPGDPLADRPRRPRSSPARTPAALEAAVLAARDQFGWGGRKIRALLRGRGLAAPCARTVQRVLRRHGRTRPPAAPPAACQRFDRREPNELWQLDFKGPLEVARSRVSLLSVLDDHSRYLLALEVVPDQTMARAWEALWRLFGEAGLPAAVLCDNAFAARGPGGAGVGWFEARLIRLGVRPLHGRPYHPQTQGKVERLHGTLQAEALPRARRDDAAAFAADLERWRREVYNALRPHEALGDEPPATRWRPSARPRPAELPAVEYPAGSPLRKVMQRGEVSWRGYEVLVGAGLTGEWVRVEDGGGEVAFFYAWKEVRRLRWADMHKRGIL